MTAVMCRSRPGLGAHSAAPMVLHVRVVSGEGGGPEKTILNSPRYLKEAGYRSVCAYLRAPRDTGFESIRVRATQAAAPLEAVDDNGPLDWRVFQRLRRICRDLDVAIWHGHDYKSNLLGLLLRRRHPMQLVTTVHGWVEKSSRLSLYYQIDQACLRHYDRVLCVSEDLLNECRRVGVRMQRCRLIHNAIDENAYLRRHSVAVAKSDLGFAPEEFLLGAVGRLSAEKGFDRLIRAAGRLREQGLALQLVIVGEGRQRPQLENLITELQLQGKVHLLGHRTDVVALYEAMDVFVLSSLREGLPNVVLEAMALATPVVATRVAGVPTLIEDGVTGRLVEPDNVEQLATAIRELLQNPEQRAAFAAAARRRIELNYSFRARMQKIAAVYDELLQRSVPGE